MHVKALNDPNDGLIDIAKCCVKSSFFFYSFLLYLQSYFVPVKFRDSDKLYTQKQSSRGVL